MKFKSQVMTQVSGSIGGITYAHNRGGLYQRARAIPTNPSSTPQITVRANFSNLATRWGQTLTAAQRLAWENYAANSPVTDVFGDSMLLTGQQMYIRCNSVRLRASETVVDDGPTTYGLASLSAPQIAASIGAGSLFVVFNAGDTWANEDNGGLAVQTSRFLGPGINFHRSPFRFLSAIGGNSTTAPTSPFDVGSDTAYGEDVANATAGQRIFGRFVAYLDDGRISPAVRFNGAVIA